MSVQANGHANGSKPFFAARLSKQMSNLLREWNETPRLAWEVKNLSTVLQVDRAHVVMLAEQGHLTKDQAGAILRGLEKIRQAGPEKFSTAPGYGSIVLQIERQLSEMIGEDVAGRLPIARSRLDQGATVKRLVDRDNIMTVYNALLGLQASLLKVAEEQRDTPMISYTHLQQAQPANFGHYILAFKERLDDSVQQLQQLYERVDRNPLGTVGLSGTDMPINRQRTTHLLGFGQLVDNSRLGRDGYYQIEIVFALTMILTILNDLCSDLHIFSSIEFGTVELDDSHCSTSSIFPQKKNPYALETVKGKAGDAAGWMASALATFRNEGTSDNQARTVSCLAEAYRTTTGMLQLTSEVVELMAVKRERWEEHLSNAWVTTNRLGNILLSQRQHGLDYRTAHDIVARLVKTCMIQGIRKSDVTVDMLQVAARETNAGSVTITQEELRAALDHTEFIEKAVSLGSIGPGEVDRLLTTHRQKHGIDSAWIEDRKKHVAKAETDLDIATEKWID